MALLLRLGLFILSWVGSAGDAPAASIRLRRQRVLTLANKGRAPSIGSGSRVGKNLTAPFLVWTKSRSGSEWFMLRLSMHSNVCSSPLNCNMCPTESMSPVQQEALSPPWEKCIARDFLSAHGLGRGGSTIDAQSLFKTYVKDLFGGQLAAPALPVGTTAVGYKFATSYLPIYEQEFGVSTADVMETIKHFGLRVVVLERENKLDQYISWLVAVKTGVWHIDDETSQADKDKVNDLRLTVNTEEMLEFINRSQAGHLRDLELLNHYAITNMPVSYEGCVKQMKQCLCDVSKFLRLPCEDVAETGFQLAKTNTVSRRDRITNFDQVVEALVNNGFSSFLE